VGFNENLSLKCEVDSNPNSSISWFLNGSHIYSYPVLNINYMRKENFGTYTCNASLKDFPTVSSSTTVVPPGYFFIFIISIYLFGNMNIRTLGPPIIMQSTSPQYLKYGEKGGIECVIQQQPKQEVRAYISWFLHFILSLMDH
jgi:hypothetical protein